MELIEMVVIILHITATIAKKKHKGKQGNFDMIELNANSDESIENLLYYKDCNHKKDNPPPIVLRDKVTEAPPPNPCPCPRMCCSMCCDCNAPVGPMSFVGRQMAPLQSAAEPMQVAPQPSRHHPPGMMPQQPQLMPRSGKMKRPHVAPKPPELMSQPPIGSRRDFGFTRENIKNLISHDQDIKKILKDLVRVTMHKVDLVEHINARRAEEKSTTQRPKIEEDEDTDYFS